MLKNGLYNTVGTVVRMLLGILIIPLLIRLVGLDNYGLWMLVSSVVGLVELAEVGLSISTTYFVSRDLGKTDSEGLSQTLTVVVVMMMLLATLAALFLWWGAEFVVRLMAAIDASQRLIAVQGLKIGVVVVWTQLLQRIAVGIEQAHQRYGVLNALNIAQALLSTTGLLVVAYLGGGVVAMVRWQAILNSCILILHIFVVVRLLRFTALRFAWNTSRMYAIVRYSILTWVVSLSGALFTQADRLIVGAVLGTGPLGVYSAITTVVSKISALSAVPIQPLLPTLSALTSRPGSEQVPTVKYVRLASSLNAVIALGLASLLFLLSPWVMRIMLSEPPTQISVMACRLAVIAYGLYALNAVGYFVLFSMSQVKQLAVVHMISAAVSLSFIAIGAHMIGLTGAVAGNAGYIGTWWLVWAGMKCINIPVRSWLKWYSFPLLWFGGILLLGTILQDEIFLKVTLTVMAGIGFLWWFLTTQPEYREWVNPILERLRG